tara:strand:- start:2835 stop:4667 length:1833 start_codon:yes stop_codon:yes gene_type:complete
MANSFVRYTGNGSTSSYAVPFSYRAQGDVAITIDGVATTAFTWDGAGTNITFTSPPADTSSIEIRRTTSQASRLVDYADGSVLKENDLDTDSQQGFFMGQEAIDDAADKIKLDNADFQWDAQSKRLKNVADPTGAQDVATKNYIESTWLSAADKTTLENVNSNISAINTVNSNISAITTNNSNSTNINTVATNIGSVNTVASDITKVVAVANDLAEAVSEVETVADDLNEATSEIDTVASSITNVDAVGTNIANVNSVAGNETNINAVNSNSANINTVAGANANITTVAGANANITTLAGINADITTVAGISSNVTSVAGNETNINAVNTNSSNINTVAGSIANVNTVGGDIANVNTVAGNISGVNSFGDRYRVSSSAPASSLDVGDLYFDTTANELKVYKSSGWAAAGSTVNGTSARFTYTATAAQTTFTGADVNGETLAYDAGYADVYLNGVRLSGADITITSGTSVVLASGASAGDILDIVAYGTFNVAAVDGSAINSGTINEARLPASALGAVWESKNADFTAEARKNYFIDTTSTDIDVTLPSGTIGDEIRFLDVAANLSTNDLTILNGSSKIQGASANLDVTTNRAGFALVYYNSTQGWLLKDK